MGIGEYASGFVEYKVFGIIGAQEFTPEGAFTGKKYAKPNVELGRLKVQTKPDKIGNMYTHRLIYIIRFASLNKKGQL